MKFIEKWTSKNITDSDKDAHIHLGQYSERANVIVCLLYELLFQGFVNIHIFYYKHILL